MLHLALTQLVSHLSFALTWAQFVFIGLCPNRARIYRCCFLASIGTASFRHKRLIDERPGGASSGLSELVSQDPRLVGTIHEWCRCGCNEGLCTK